MSSKAQQVREDEITTGELDLPEGWASAKLFDLCRPTQWPTVPTKKLTPEGFPVFGANGQIGFYSEYNHDKPTVLITCRGATCGTLNLSKPRSYVTGNAMALDDVPEKLLNLQFLLCALKSRGLEDTISGSAQPQITRQNLEPVEIALAPLDEQIRIVDRIQMSESQFANLRGRLSKTQKLIQQFRQVVLAAACSGKLTEEWRGNNPDLEMQIDALRSVIGHYNLGLARRGKERNPNAGVRSSTVPWQSQYGSDSTLSIVLPELPVGWAWIPLGVLGTDPLNTVQTGPFGALLHNSEFVTSGVPVIAVGNLTGMGFTTDDLYYITQKKAYELRRFDVQSGDVLFARSGATLGKVCVAPHFVNDWRMTGHILRARLQRELVLPEYAVYALHGAAAVTAQVAESVRGVTRPGFNTTLLESIRIPLPPISEQREIVRRVEALFKLADAIEKRVAAATALANNLTQAVLAKAFRGELVPTEAELARRGGREYEPASVLLERIKVEREKTAGTRKK